MIAQQSHLTLPWSMVTTGLRVIGFLLIGLGTLIAVAFASLPGSCAPGSTPACTSFPSQYLNAILTAKVLWTLGLIAVGGASGIGMHQSWGRADTGAPGDNVWTNRYRANLVMVVLSVLLLALLLLTLPVLP